MSSTPLQEKWRGFREMKLNSWKGRNYYSRFVAAGEACARLYSDLLHFTALAE